MEYTNPLKQSSTGYFAIFAKDGIFLLGIVTSPQFNLWHHANAIYWHCDVIFVDCSCTRKLAKRRLLVNNNRKLEIPPSGIHGLECKNLFSLWGRLHNSHFLCFQIIKRNQLERFLYNGNMEWLLNLVYHVNREQFQTKDSNWHELRWSYHYPTCYHIDH